LGGSGAELLGFRVRFLWAGGLVMARTVWAKGGQRSSAAQAFGIILMIPSADDDTAAQHPNTPTLPHHPSQPNPNTITFWSGTLFAFLWASLLPLSNSPAVYYFQNI